MLTDDQHRIIYRIRTAQELHKRRTALDIEFVPITEFERDELMQIEFRDLPGLLDFGESGRELWVCGVRCMVVSVVFG